ncbi:16S rRNA (uracil(1498)-N(3))-methyltransferase [Acinetobacter qingfengensis]|uniref:Ribosomal RNA small subunit methyltransferase E n=1 Tax=Acinetobacter qingfengensis TaxID=1262585 RepID=A0A1E7RC43_9GAMM|nr:16S rRNA (uracil(1498)-N(3))-methyltransferase [Acinetobacter qingfengensis]KAA8734848.1 16S rRNA (uracil(1498)-N(3))-methyltransferase [Acinetobacter qingfengensis]OEY96891.1 16S rRNA (uracil(1498)-N(3))-methyltransferase [Acinetobacter qingfengensis]
MNRFYMDAALTIHDHVILSETVFHHWCRVLRGKIDDQAILFNGQGGEYLVRLIDINKKNASVYIEQFFADDRTLAVNVTIGQVMSKGDRMDYAIQKATELGVHSIQLLTSERCEMRLKYDRDQKKFDHWQGIAIAACEQCGMNRIPKILAPLAVETWVQQHQADLKLVMALSQEKFSLPTPLPQNIAVLIGPEGGLSDTEIHTANQYDFQSWTIGSRVLRTETAPIVALSIFNLLCQ